MLHLESSVNFDLYRLKKKKRSDSLLEVSPHLLNQAWVGGLGGRGNIKKHPFPVLWKKTDLSVLSGADIQMFT